MEQTVTEQASAPAPRKPRWSIRSIPMVAAIAVAVVVVILVGTSMLRSFMPASVPGDNFASVIAPDLTSTLTALGKSHDLAVVTCPNSPAKAGYIFDCDYVAGTTTGKVRVTEDDAAGHFHWQLEGLPS